MTWYVRHRDNPKLATRKWLELNDDSGKAAGCETNAQKSLAGLYTDNERSERQIKETTPFTTATEEWNTYKQTYLRRQKPVHGKLYDTDVRNRRRHKQMGRDTPCSWTGRINTVEARIPSKAIYRFSAIPLTSPTEISTELEQKTV